MCHQLEIELTTDTGQNSVSAFIKTILHPFDSLLHMYQAPLTMVRAWSDAIGKIDDWLTQFANPDMVQAFRSFSTGVTILCYTVAIGVVAIGAVAAFLFFKLAVFAGEVMHQRWIRWVRHM
ncbi:hypothetical protein ES702_02630 [subsurface metagenome]